MVAFIHKIFIKIKENVLVIKFHASDVYKLYYLTYRLGIFSFYEYLVDIPETDE